MASQSATGLASRRITSSALPVLPRRPMQSGHVQTQIRGKRDGACGNQPRPYQGIRRPGKLHPAGSPKTTTRHPKSGSRSTNAPRPQESINPEEAIEVVLCWGWIDGIRKSHDGFFQRYGPRGRRSGSGARKNVETVSRLIQDGPMTEHGLKQVDAAKAVVAGEKGLWQRQGPADSAGPQAAIARNRPRKTCSASSRAEPFRAGLPAFTPSRRKRHASGRSRPSWRC